MDVHGMATGRQCVSTNSEVVFHGFPCPFRVFFAEHCPEDEHLPRLTKKTTERHIRNCYQSSAGVTATKMILDSGRGGCRGVLRPYPSGSFPDW